MREIKFRGRHKAFINWIFGCYMEMENEDNPEESGHFIFPPNGLDSPENYEVDPKTIGQFINRIDKNGVDIYEGDICDTHRFGMEWENETDIDEILVCKYISENATFGFVNTKYGKRKDWSYMDFLIFSVEGVEVIGNIHENPELLKQ